MTASYTPPYRITALLKEMEATSACRIWRTRRVLLTGSGVLVTAWEMRKMDPAADDGTGNPQQVD